MTTLINRRSALTAVAAFPAAFAIGAPLSFTEGKPGELASLIRRYFKEVKAFHDSDLVADDDYFLADAPFDATLRKMVGAPASTREDALAAITWIIFEGKESMIELAGDTLYGQVTVAVHDSLAGRVAWSEKFGDDEGIYFDRRVHDFSEAKIAPARGDA